MRRRGHPLDETTADRLVGGELTPAEAPPGYDEVVRLLAQVRHQDLVTDPDDRFLGDLVLAITATPEAGATTTPVRRLTAKAGALAAVALLTTAGAAAAATGNLPGPAQDAVAGVAERVGLDLPDSDEDVTTGDDTDDVADDATGGTEDGTGTGDDGGDGDDATEGTGDGTKPPTGHADNPTDADEHGATVSDVARTTEATGRDKGAEVSDTARAGHGPDATDDDDDEGDDGDTPGRPEGAGSQAPVVTPNGGGTGTAGQASDGAGDAGTDRAPDQAGLGSANAGSRR